MPALTSRLQHAWDNPLTADDGVDPVAELDDVLAPLGMSTADAGGAVTVTGRDPVVPSPVRVGAAASIGLLAKSVAAAALHRDRGGPGQDVHVDLRAAPHRLCPFYDRRWELLGGYPVASSVEQGNAMGFSFFRCADGRFVMPQNMYPHLRERAQELLGVPLTTKAVTAVIARWEAAELEEAASAAGVVMPMLRTLPEMMETAQYTDVLADLPLVEVTRIGDGDPEPHRYLDPETFTADTGLGAYQGVTDQVAMSATPGRYDPVLVARGASAREWRAH
ncbi:CoA transferase [Actinomycetospora lutea]|uniref:CoA transferase n=1 Tax=Actinomycetospora lutea TaxID=663604 RepID=UPI0023650203|nr:CoA transferase [Actinomycetospora lutea]MDD7937648.1 CoA transferase [Actinomycetospora lutea]